MSLPLRTQPDQKSCLVIEHVDHIRQFVSVNLCMRGFDVQEAETVEQALRLFERWQPSVILLEIPFITPDWHTWLPSLREKIALHDIPLIAFTTQDYALKEMQAYNPNVAAILIKPISATELINAVRKVIGVAQPRKSM